MIPSMLISSNNIQSYTRQNSYVSQHISMGPVISAVALYITEHALSRFIKGQILHKGVIRMLLCFFTIYTYSVGKSIGHLSS